MTLLMDCWIQLASILLRIFASMFIRDISPWDIFSFLVRSLSGFGIKVMLVLQNEFGSFPFISVFWNSLRIGINSLNGWQNSFGKPSVPGILFVGIFLINDSISLLVKGLFKFLISSDFHFGSLCFQKLINFFHIHGG